MKITLDNYEAYIIDYLEGRLDENTAGELKNFIALHPLIQDSLDQYSPVFLHSEEVTFGEKNSLYKFKFDETPVNKTTFNDFCIAYYENLLDHRKKEELEQFIETYPELKNDFLLYKKTYITPGKIVFPKRTNLYKQTQKKPAVIRLYTWGMVAALFLLLFGLYFGFLRNENKQQNEFVNNNKKLEKNIISYEKETATSAINELQVEAIKPKPREEKPKNTEESPVVVALENENKRNEDLQKVQPISAGLLSFRNFESPQSKVEFGMIAYFNSYKANEKEYIPDKPGVYGIDGKRYSLLSLLETSLNQLNKLSKTDIAEVTYKTDKSGKIYAYTVKAGFIEFHRNRDKN